jgi:uncharacterized protein (TIGR02594 family)
MLEPILLRVARLSDGLLEIPGPKSNPVIVKWAKDIGAPAYTNDDIPWCAVAMNRWLLACGWPLAGNGYDLLRARSFETWGQPIDEPALGCVMVFSRPEGYHVGLYLGERSDAYYVYGANQSNTVGATWISKNRLTAMRWAEGEPVESSGRILLNAQGALSTNEQ